MKESEPDLGELRKRMDMKKLKIEVIPKPKKSEIEGKEKLRIGFFSWETLNSLPVGGLAVAVTHLAESLSKLGHEVHIFTRIGDGQREHQKIRGVLEHRCISPGCDDFIEYMDHVCDSMVSCFYYIEGKYGKFDILHGHDWHVVNALANIKHHKGYEFAWTCHSTEFGRNGNSYSDSWFSARIRHREWLGGYLSNQVITVSNAMKYEIMREYQIPEEKINVAYNGVNPHRFKDKVDPGKVKERYGLSPLEPVILFVGRMSHQKGPDLLLEAIPNVLAERSDARFIFAGCGDGMIDHLHGRSRWLGVHDKTRILGHVTDEEKLELFGACDMVCVPSRNEPFGIVVLEAWACGKPVVATDVGGPGEFIHNFVTGVKVYQTPESISWGIKYLLQNPNEIKFIGKNAKKAVKDFDWDKIANEVLGVYEKVV